MINNIVSVHFDKENIVFDFDKSKHFMVHSSDNNSLNQISSLLDVELRKQDATVFYLTDGVPNNIREIIVDWVKHNDRMTYLVVDPLWDGSDPLVEALAVLSDSNPMIRSVLFSSSDRTTFFLDNYEFFELILLDYP